MISSLVCNATSTTEIHTYWRTLSLHRALPISSPTVTVRCSHIVRSCLGGHVVSFLDARWVDAAASFRQSGEAGVVAGACRCAARKRSDGVEILPSASAFDQNVPDMAELGRASCRERVCQYV